MKMFNYDVKPGNWCIPLVNNVFNTPDGKDIEIGVYREPDDGTYTLQIFDGDDVVMCKTIKIKNFIFCKEK